VQLNLANALIGHQLARIVPCVGSRGAQILYANAPSPSREVIEPATSLLVRGVALDEFFQLGPRFAHDPRLLVGFGKDITSLHGIAAPDRDLQRVEGILESPAAKVYAAKQQMRVVIIGSEIDGALKLGNRFGVAFALECPTCHVEMKRSQLALLALL